MKMKYPFLLFAVLLLGSCAENPATGARQFSLLSESQEYAMGDEAVEEAVKQSGGVYNAPQALQSYYQSLANKVAQQTERSRKEFNFYLLDDPMANAFALPGHVAFSRGLLPYLQNEAQLVSVLGHEVGHVSARHSAQTMSRGILAELGILAAQIAVASKTDNDDLVHLAGMGTAIGVGVAMAGYSRGQELEADGLGLRYMAALGYNPRDAAGAFAALQRNRELVEKLRADAGFTDKMNGFHRVFASHPDEVKRIEEIIAKTQTTATTASPNEAKYMQAIDGITFGMKPTEVVAVGQTLYGVKARGKITFPKSFFVNGYINGVPYAFEPDRKIQVNIASLKVLPRVTPTEQLKGMLGLRRASITDFAVNNLTGVKAVVSEGHRKEHLYLLKDENSKVDDEGNPQSTRDMFLVEFSIPQAQSQAFEAEADSIMQSFKRITAAEAKAVKPAVMRTRAVRSGDTVESLAAKQPFGPYNELFFRTFNALDGTSQPKVGGWVKFVE